MNRTIRQSTSRKRIRDTKRVALIGADGCTSSDEERRLNCYSWERLGNVENLRDFDDVVVNLMSLPAAKKVDEQAFQRIFTLNAMGEILGHDGRIILLGDPRIELPSSRSSDGGDDVIRKVRWGDGSFLKRQVVHA